VRAAPSTTRVVVVPAWRGEGTVRVRKEEGRTSDDALRRRRGNGDNDGPLTESLIITLRIIIPIIT